MSRSIDRRILNIAAATDHVVTRSQLLEAGISSASISRRVGETLDPMASGVYAVGRTGHRQLLRASTMSVAGSALADLTAAEELSLPAPRSSSVTVVARRGEARAVPDGVVLRLSRHLPDEDIEIVDGIRSTSVERTVCDLGRILHAHRLQRLIEQLITDRRMSSRSFVACASAFCRRGRTGSAVVRLLRSELVEDQPVPASELERRGMRLLADAGITGAVLHFVPPWSDGTTGVVDLGWEPQRVIVELDGRRWHATTASQQNDRRRDRVANAHGWLVLRFGWQEVVERPEQVGREIRWLLKSRKPAVLS